MDKTTISRYTIIDKLGAGGMGEVYLAQDTTLDRKIALKVLPADVASNNDRMERFVREAKAAAALNHPNIAQVFEIGEHEGTHFIAMEFIDGVTLREKIHLERRDLRPLLKNLQQVAEGLSKAHSAGIVHRDLKPDNIMITRDGFAKVLDFGLAKLVEKSGPDFGQSDDSNAPTNVMQQHSVPGTVMGTVGYMSPEQAQGKTTEIDQRSDIFSFGCILFEAVTGKKPFEGDSVIKSLHSLIYEPAPLIRDLNPAAPLDLQRIVGRCLEKDADERYQTIKDVGIELKNLRRGISAAIEAQARSISTNQQGAANISGDSSSGSSLGTDPISGGSTQSSSIENLVMGIKSRKLAALLSIIVVAAAIAGFAAYRRSMNKKARIESIAVMPFVNETGNAEVEYLSDGMTETLINSLSELPNVSVKARSSVFRYKGKEINSKKIASELNVQAILTGRVAQRSDQLTLNLELIDAQSENVLWGNRYERQFSDLISLQGEIARDVSNKLKTKLSGADAAKVEKTYTANPEAYQLYLKGRFQWNERTGASLKQAVDFYQQAIKKDPNYALAYSGLAETYVLFSSYDVASALDSMPQAKAAALRALEMDDSLAEAHTALAFYLSNYEWNRAASEKEYRRAIDLKPNYATAHHWLGADLGNIRRFDDSLVELRRAEELDPLSPIIGTNLADTLVLARRYDEAIAQHKRVLVRNPNFGFAHVALSRAYGSKGMYAEAIAEARRALELNYGSSTKGYLGLWLARSGKRDEALKLLGELRQEATQTYVQGDTIAFIYIGLGDKSEALNWLEKHMLSRAETANTYAVDPQLDELRDEPRFKAMLKQMNLPE